MAMAFGILTIAAGVAYLLWQVHKESGGFISGSLLVLFGISAPILFLGLLTQINSIAAIIFGVIFIIAVIVLTIYWIASSDRMSREVWHEATDIWTEVYKLPIPDADTLRQYKLANKIPLYPEDCEAYNKAAIQAWRVSEYNKRYKEKHKIVFYIQ